MEQTPVMKQYWDLKSQDIAQGALLLFRMGDFYELFGDDAVEAAKLLDITLTSRDKLKQTPMAGVPHHSAQHYIQKLLKAGKKVAIAEQMDMPAAAKGIVTRDIVRVLTPAIQFETESAGLKLLACLVPHPTLPDWALGAVDVSTGHTFFSEPQSLDVWLDRWSTLQIAHLLYPMANPLPEAFLHGLPKELLIETTASGLISETALKHAFPTLSLASLKEFLPDEWSLLALSTVLQYALRSQRAENTAGTQWSHLKLPQSILSRSTLALGSRTSEHLDLDGLMQLCNETKSAAGARLFRRWLHEPLKSIPEISSRQLAVRALADHPLTLQNLRGAMAKVYDTERILGRVHTGLAMPKDTWALAESIEQSASVHEWLNGLKHSDRLQTLSETLKQCLEKVLPIARDILRTQNPLFPSNIRDGGIFVRGTDAELDRWISLCDESDQWLLNFEASERAATGIGSLKVKYNRVTGYSIEITKSNLKQVPPHYQRKQSMVGSERFVTEELSRFDEERSQAQAKRAALEETLFDALIKRIAASAQAFVSWAETISELDVLQGLATLKSRPGWCMPDILPSGPLELEGSRHPMVDQALGQRFVPNDIVLNASELKLITGPNMGGKSTLLRQLGLTVILGQMGAPVPARKARWGLFDAVFTRIGAHDAIARGQSTFLVEMTELAQILNVATNNSLIVLDEIGRGTSTFDGMSVAWAVLEHIALNIRARTLFATHYHELTDLERVHPQITNGHMGVQQSNDGSRAVSFLYQLKSGPASESFGVHVAKMAGLPKSVIDRAWNVLEQWEQRSARKPVLRKHSAPQLELLL